MKSRFLLPAIAALLAIALTAQGFAMPIVPDPAEVAADEIVEIIEGALDDGDFDDVIAAINAALPDEFDDYTAEDVEVGIYRVPDVMLGDLQDGLYVRVMPGPESDEEPSGQQSTAENINVDIAIETGVDSANSNAVRPLVEMGRQIWCLVAKDPDKANTPRRLNSVGGKWHSSQVTARYDPALLRESSAFLYLCRHFFETVT